MYNEKEITKILRRAHELQNRSEGSVAAAEANQELSLEEVEEIARESGLSAEYVRQAAIEFEGVPVEEPLFLDTGNTYEVELIGFAKGELNKKTWAELRAVIEYHFDSPGKVKRHPDGVVWKAQPKGIFKFLHTQKSPKVKVSSSNNKTTIRVTQSLKTIHKLMYPVYAALAGAAAIFGVSMLEGPEGLFFVGGLLVLAKMFHAWANSKKQKARDNLKDAVEQLQTIVNRRHAASENKAASSKENAQNRLEELEIDGESATETTRSSKRERTREKS